MRLFLLGLLLTLTCLSASSQTISWNFTDSFPSSQLISNVAVSHLSRGNNNGTTTLLTNTSASNSYSGSSGTFNAGAAARIGVLNTAASGSAYFEITFTPASGYQFSISNIAFGSRSTGTGPKNFTVRSSLDSFASDILTLDTLSSNSIWAYQNSAITSQNSSANAFTIRIFGYGGAGSPTTGTANWRIDDLLITGSTSAAGPQAPSPITALTLTGLTKSSAQVSWNYPTSFVDTTQTIIVFAKKDTAILGGTPTLSAANYTASSDFSIPGTTYEKDSNAFCVYKGDAAGFVLSGLQTSTSYFLRAYVTSDADSLYSTATVAGGISSAYPQNVTALQATSGGQNSVQIHWLPPSGYTSVGYSTLVFVKSDSAITGVPTQEWAANYTANSDFMGSSSVLATDSFARCVFNNDDSTVTVTGLTASTVYYISVFTFREADSTYSTGNSSNVQTDGLFAAPKPVVSVSASNIAYETLDLNWAKDSTYIDSVHTILVFAKQGSAIITGVNTFDPFAYTASSVFGAGTMYENDSNAFCVYNGDSTGVSISSLQNNSTYHFLVYVIRDMDISYSTAATSSATTPEFPPAAVSGITVSGTSQTTARISWTKPAGYSNSRFTTLAFVKAGAINPGTVNKSVTAYTASTVLGIGSMFDADSSAYCVFKGDTNFVNITALSSQTQYHVVIFVMRDADSVESIPANGDGLTQGPPPTYAIGSINTTNPTTGLADSNGVRVTVKGTVYGFNQRASGHQFLLKDSTGGITLFHASKNFGYTVLEGDRIEAEGLINTFRGLNEITLDTIRYVSSGNPIDAPRKVQVLTESTENDLVKVDSVRFVTTPSNGIWPTASTNIRVVTPTNDTVVVRVISTSGLAGKPLPTTPTFSIAGIGSQNTTATAPPYPFNGYQLFPRSQNDATDIAITPVDSMTPFHLLAPASGDTIVVTESNLNDIVTIRWSASTHSNSVDPTQYTFWLDTLGGDFGNPLDEIDNGPDTVMLINKQAIKDIIIDPLQIPQGGMFAGIWQITAASGSLVRTSEEIFTIYIINDFATGLAEQVMNQRISLSPNPAIGHTTVGGLHTNDQVQLMDLTGKVVFTQKATESTLLIPTLDLNAGVYFVRIQNHNSAVTRKLLVP